MSKLNAGLKKATWVISSERGQRDRSLRWMAQLFTDDQLVFVATSASHRDPREAAAFVRKLRAALPQAEIRNAPTLGERMDADSRLAEERERTAQKRQERLSALWEEADRRSEEDSWTEEDWDRFHERVDAIELEDEEDEDEEWDDEDASIDGSLVWEVRTEGGRPQGVLFWGRTAVLSTAGLLRIDDVRALIEWSRTSEVVKAPIERR